MANPKIKFKRSAVAFKTPTLENIELGELALNTYDGKVFLRQDTGGVGIATTVTVVNPWTENYGATEIAYTGDVGVVGLLTANAFRSGNIFATGVTTSIGGFILRNPDDVSFDTTSLTFDDTIKPPSFDSSPISAGIYADGSASFSGIVTASGGFIGGLAGNVTGNISGNLSGNITSNTIVSGVTTFQSHVNLGDNDKLKIGNDGDLEIYHDGSHSFIDDAGTGNIYVRSGTTVIQNAAGNKTSAVFNSGSGQELNYNNTKRFETTNTGANVTGTLNVTGVTTAGSFVGDLTGNVTGNTSGTAGGLSGSPDITVTNVTAGIVTTTKLHVGVDTGFFTEDLVVTGDARVTGILTIGQGSITLDPSTDTIKIGQTKLVRDTDGSIDFRDVVTNARRKIRIDPEFSGLSISGVVTATSFIGDGSNLTGVAASAVSISTSAPSSPSVGDLWFDPDYGRTVVYYNDGDSAQWIDSSPVPTTAVVAISTSLPLNPQIGDLWFDPEYGRTVIYYNDGDSAQWIDSSPVPTTISSATNLVVTGICTATSFDGNLTGNVTGDLVGNVTGNVELNIGAVEGVNSTTTSTSEASVDSFAAATYRSVTYDIQVTRGSLYHTTTIKVLHDGTSTYMTEYGSINTGTSLATFSSDINSGNVRLLATPTSATSTAFKIVKTIIKV